MIARQSPAQESSRGQALIDELLTARNRLGEAVLRVETVLRLIDGATASAMREAALAHADAGAPIKETGFFPSAEALARDIKVFADRLTVAATELAQRF